VSDADVENQPDSTTKPGNPVVGRIFTGFLYVTLIGTLVLLVVPNIPAIDTFGGRPNRATREMKGVELALGKILADTGVFRLRDLFTDPNAMDRPSVEATVEQHTNAIYQLLRNGKNAQLDLRPETKSRLGGSYTPFLSSDPWRENRYVFYMPHGHGEEANELDRRFIETYMTYITLGGETEAWRSEPPIYIVCRGEDGHLELLDSADPGTTDSVGDDLSNLRDPSPHESVDKTGIPASSR